MHQFGCYASVTPALGCSCIVDAHTVGREKILVNIKVENYRCTQIN